MARSDIWNLYKGTPLRYHDRNGIQMTRVSSTVAELEKDSEPFTGRGTPSMSIADLTGSKLSRRFPSCQSSPADHLVAAVNDFNFRPLRQLFQGIAELVQVDLVKARTNSVWYLPQYGGQESSWQMRSRIAKGIANICQTQLDQSRRRR